ncbi:MAG: S8 family peptidase [Saprospiraceae bacterium]
MIKRTILPVLTGLLLSSAAFAQDSPPDNWFNLDPSSDQVAGVGTERIYKELLKGKQGQTVIVAIIDSGVDAEHEDLKDVMWVNKGEIPANGKDDDGNGYIDDVHGWNFIGGPNGNVSADQLEVTRLVKIYGDQFAKLDTNSLSKKERIKFAEYKEMKAVVDKSQSKAEQSLAFYKSLFAAGEKIKSLSDKEVIMKDDLLAFKSDDDDLMGMVQSIARNFGPETTLDQFSEQVQGGIDYFASQAASMYNLDFDGRSIVGDNYFDSSERFYGNNDVKGPDASHGTHVAGIVAASRNNNIGMNGVANNVQIMSVRAVPDGDERDKDVANAIRYAVDNGASVINMSFGKGYTWDKKVVDQAVKYAAKNDVLLVHAAGNSSENTDVSDNFPVDEYARKGFFKFLQKKYPNNWLEIGALSWKKDADAVATFSNYGKTNVDIFSPGVDIYSTTPDGGYDSYSGTSMASPVTAGVAALIRGYFPELKASEVKEILLMSGTSMGSKMVKLPGAEDGDELVRFDTLSQTGKILNAYNAVKLAQRKTGKSGGMAKTGV